MPKAVERRRIGLRWTDAPTSSSYVYLSAHKPQLQDGGDKHALLVAGLPVRVDSQSLQTAFAQFGAVKAVVLYPSKVTALVCFQQASSVQAALAAADGMNTLEADGPPEPAAVGLKSWMQEHQSLFPPHKVLQEQLDDWVERFEQAEAEAQRARAAALSDAGWTLVARGKGRARTRDVDGATVTTGGRAAAAAQADLEAAAPKEFQDFYRFQAKEKRLNELSELQRRFEEDKRRVAELRASRRFKPY